MRVCCCHTQPSPLPSRLFNVKVGHWDHLAVLLQSPLGGAKRSQTRTPQGEGRNRRPRRKDDRPLHRPLLRLLCRCCLLDCIALHHKNEGVGSSETSPNLINLGTFYEAPSDFSNGINFMKLDNTFCNLLLAARPPRPFPPARPKMWSLQAIKSISLWSLHSSPLQLDVIFGVLDRPSIQDVVSSRHRAG